MGGMINAVQGAGTLKGSPFLLFNDWKNLSDRPDFDLYQQTNKARDILIRTTVIVTLNRGSGEKYKEDLDGLWKELTDLMGEHYDFASIEGSNDWKNEYWKKLSHLLYGLYLLQAKERIIETEGEQNMTAPFSMRGDPDAQ
jgi:hypothetical protein